MTCSSTCLFDGHANDGHQRVATFDPGSPKDKSWLRFLGFCLSQPVNPPPPPPPPPKQPNTHLVAGSPGQSGGISAPLVAAVAAVTDPVVDLGGVDVRRVALLVRTSVRLPSPTTLFTPRGLLFLEDSPR